MKVSIRQATVADVEIVAEYNARLAEETERTQLDGQRLRRGVTAILSDSAKGLYFLAEVDGRAIGQISVTYEWSDWRNGNFWWLQSVYIEAAFRGSGVLKCLFRHLIDLSEVNSSICGLRLYVDKENDPARAVYRRLGFEPAHYTMMELAFNAP
ncbi:MAG: GNAT family N-acetyltransferase [Gammaproteobacteria bacterium]|nr:GNAT family N-acetyltransferase [Gammaproteobacteria bacterium]